MKKRAAKPSKQDEKIRAVTAWQTSGQFHPLTCGNDSAHRPLEAVKSRTSVLLRCPDCDYTQTFIPAIVLKAGADLVKHPSNQGTVVIPPIDVSFEDAVTRLLKVRPAAKKRAR